MKENIDIEKLFQDKFQNFEAPVDPKIWTGVSEVIGSGAKVAKAGLSLFAKVGIGTVLTMVTGIILYSTYFNNSINDNSVTQLKDINLENKLNIESSKIISANQFNDVEIIENIDEIEKQLIDEQQTFENDVVLINSQEKVIDELEKIQEIVISNEKIDLSDVFEDEINLKEIVFNGPILKEATIENESTKENETIEDSETLNNGIADGADMNIIAETVVEEDLVIDQSYIEKYPNVFTPNGDGANEYFVIESSNITSMNIIIQDKYQVKVFESNQVDFKWDGRNLFGDKVEKGTYYYSVVAVGNDGKVYKHTSILKVW